MTKYLANKGLDDRVATTRGVDTRRYVYDMDGRVIGEYGVSATDVKAEFIWLSPEVANDNQPFGGDDGTGGYAPLAVATGPTATPTLTWVHGTHLGVPTVYTDSNGTATPTPSGYDLPGFPGQSRTLADLYYNRYRDYDTTTGRYIQADLIGLAGGPSPYSYAMNNPVQYMDPSGRFVPVVIMGGIVGGAALEFGIQAASNWWNGRKIFDVDCYDWKEIGLSAVLGGVGGGAGSILGGALKCGPRSLTRITQREWSHFVPRKLVDKYAPDWAKKTLNQRGGPNGRWVTPKDHFRHDPHRWPSEWQGMPGRFRYGWQQTLDRTPAWMRGVVAGITSGSIAGEGDGE